MAKSLKEKVEEFIAPKKKVVEVKKEVVKHVVPEFDPSIPENKQRHLR